ncbi:MAG: hypothetical protein ACXVZN_08245 [Gaiellaceae bacterium]
MKRAIVFLMVALALPTSVALAKSPNAGGNGGGGKSAPKVNYILKGTLSSYTAGTQISITVKHSNYHARALNTKTLTFTLTAKSRVTFMRGSHANGQIADGTKGYIVARAPKKLTGDPVTALPDATTRIHVVVLKAPAPTS